jgi:DNA-binding HxlR family transcriptional regulator
MRQLLELEHGRGLVQPGERALKLLADERVVALLQEVAGGPLRPVEIERRLPGIGHAALIERLGRLSREQPALYERLGGRGRAVRYGLSQAGRELAQIVVEAGRQERRHREGVGVPPGVRALKLVAHECNRAIGRTLAYVPLTLTDLERSLPRVAHTSLMRHLHQLCDGGAVGVRHSHESGRTAYELTAQGRRLALLVVLASRWEGRWASEGDGMQSSDIHGLVHVIAPLARIAPGIAGICRLHVLAPPGEPTVDLAVGSSRISSLALSPLVPLDAYGCAGASTWAQALLSRDPTAIAMEGDRVLLSEVVVALGTALHG